MSRVTLLPGRLGSSSLRRVGTAPSAELRGLLGQRMSFDFRDTELADIVAFFQKTTSVNFVLDPKLQTQPITFVANDMAWAWPFEWTAKLAGCGAVYVNQAVYFSDKPFRGPRKMVIYDIADLTMPIRDFPGPSLSLSDAR